MSELGYIGQGRRLEPDFLVQGFACNFLKHYYLYTSFRFLHLSPPLLRKGRMSPWHICAIFTGVQEGIFHGGNNKNHGWVLSIDDPVSNVGRFLADFVADDHGLSSFICTMGIIIEPTS